MSAIIRDKYLIRYSDRKYEITDNYLNNMLAESYSSENEYWHILMVFCALSIYLFLIINIYSSFIEKIITA